VTLVNETHIFLSQVQSSYAGAEISLELKQIVVSSWVLLQIADSRYVVTAEMLEINQQFA
jgi:hypothetical protein